MDKIYKIYKVTNKLNGKCYIGQTCMDIKQRWSIHKSTNSCRALAGAINKYGNENFTIEWICSSKCRFAITDMEDHFIIEFKSRVPNGYNINKATHIGIFDGTVKDRMRESYYKRFERMSQEEKDIQHRGIYKYIEEKKVPIICINEDHNIIRFDSETAAKRTGFWFESEFTKGYYIIKDNNYTDEQITELYTIATNERKERDDINRIKRKKALSATFKSEKMSHRAITGVNPETGDIVNYINMNQAFKEGHSSSSLQASLKGELKRSKGFHFFKTKEHTIDEMFEIAKENNLKIREIYLNGRKKAVANMQDHINSQKVQYIGINPKTLEYQIFESMSEATRSGYNTDAMRRGARGEKRTSKKMHFQKYTLTPSEHIEITKDIFS